MHVNITKNFIHINPLKGGEDCTLCQYMKKERQRCKNTNISKYKTHTAV